MPEYRFYMLNSAGKILGPSVTKDLPDDSAAVREARWMAERGDIEIWCGTCLVARLDGPKAPEGNE